MGQPPTKTLADPVDPETLSSLETLRKTRFSLGLKLLELEEEKGDVLEAAAQTDLQRVRIFERVLTERGISPKEHAQIDTKTGKVVLKPKAPPPKPKPKKED